MWEGVALKIRCPSLSFPAHFPATSPHCIFNQAWFSPVTSAELFGTGVVIKFDEGAAYEQRPGTKEHFNADSLAQEGLVGSTYVNVIFKCYLCKSEG